MSLCDRMPSGYAAGVGSTPGRAPRDRRSGGASGGRHAPGDSPAGPPSDRCRSGWTRSTGAAGTVRLGARRAGPRRRLRHGAPGGPPQAPVPHAVSVASRPHAPDVTGVGTAHGRSTAVEGPRERRLDAVPDPPADPVAVRPRRRRPGRDGVAHAGPGHPTRDRLVADEEATGDARRSSRPTTRIGVDAAAASSGGVRVAVTPVSATDGRPRSLPPRRSDGGVAVRPRGGAGHATPASLTRVRPSPPAPGRRRRSTSRA